MSIVCWSCGFPTKTNNSHCMLELRIPNQCKQCYMLCCSCEFLTKETCPIARWSYDFRTKTNNPHCMLQLQFPNLPNLFHCMLVLCIPNQRKSGSIVCGSDEFLNPASYVPLYVVAVNSQTMKHAPTYRHAKMYTYRHIDI